MFRPLNDADDQEAAKSVDFTFDGRVITARAGMNLAQALLAAGVSQFRSAVPKGDPRGPYCLMGVCFECLLTIDGMRNQQACLTEVRAGLEVTSQKGSLK